MLHCCLSNLAHIVVTRHSRLTFKPWCTLGFIPNYFLFGAYGSLVSVKQSREPDKSKEKFESR